MVIDFHAHIFPDELAERALAALLPKVGGTSRPVHNGTVSGLLKNMDAWGIDVTVIQPVVTKQTQVKRTNEWVRSLCSDRLVCFGGIFPHTDDYKRDIDFVAGLGLKGLKFHAEFQDFILDDPKMLKIYDYALSKGLILLHHGGFDPGFPPPYKSTPQRFANIASEMKGGVIIAAHLGGHGQWGDVERFLAGSGIYLDTSMGLDFYSKEQFLRIFEIHGADKILFASDSPWGNAKKEYEHIKALPISEENKERILCGNAKRILNLNN